MRQIYLALFLGILVKANAQTLTQSFNEPVIGDVDKNYKLDTSAYTNGLPLNVTGSNCVWNFTALTGVFPMIIDSFIAPTAATGFSAYPGASYAQHRDILYTYYKSTASPQQTELLGAYSPSLSLTFTNSAIIAGYPVNYGYYLSDPVSGTFKYNTTNGVCNGNITISADGSGTVNFPNNISIQNVLRLKSVEILTLSVGILPSGTINQTIYNYYAPGKKFPIISINYTTYQLIAGTPTISALVYGSNSYFSVVGLGESREDKENYTVYPNPFHDHLFINAGNHTEENDYAFYDLGGQLILRTRSLTGLGTEALTRGIYFLEIKNKLGQFHQKIIKE